jgi:hypothetical protein
LHTGKEKCQEHAFVVLPFSALLQCPIFNHELYFALCGKGIVSASIELGDLRIHLLGEHFATRHRRLQIQDQLEVRILAIVWIRIHKFLKFGQCSLVSSKICGEVDKSEVSLVPSTVQFMQLTDSLWQCLDDASN